MLFQMFTIHTLHWFCYAWHVYRTNTHIWQATGLFLICQTCITGYCLCVCWFLGFFGYFENEPEPSWGYFAQSHADKIISNPSFWLSKTQLPLKTTFVFSVAAHLININWDEKEKHQVSVSLYESAHLTREGYKHQPDLGTPTFREVKAGEGHLLCPVQACRRGLRDSTGDAGWHRLEFQGETLGRLWRRSCIKEDEERVVLCHCSPSGPRGCLQKVNASLPLICTVGIVTPSKLAALFQKSVKLLYFIRVTKIPLYCFFSWESWDSDPNSG